MKKILVLILFFLCTTLAYSECGYVANRNVRVFREPEDRQSALFELPLGSVMNKLDSKRVNCGGGWAEFTRIKTKSGVCGWVNSRYISQVSDNISEKTIVGKWVHFGGTEESSPGTMVFKNDHTFVIRGWDNPNFESQGLWEYKQYVLYLRFTDNKHFWRSAATKSMVGATYNFDNAYVYKVVFTGENLDFFGFYFFRKQ